jgi:hypothetical protein
VSRSWRFGGIGVVMGLILIGSCVSDPCACPPALEVVTVVDGNHQIGTAGQALARLIVVRADAQIPSIPGLSGRTLYFVPQPGSGSVSASSLTTNAEGLAEVAWTLGPDSGADTLIVRMGSPDIPEGEATITATAQ